MYIYIYIISNATNWKPTQYSTNIVKTQNFQHFSLAYDRKHSQYSFMELKPKFGSPCHYIYIILLPKINGA